MKCTKCNLVHAEGVTDCVTPDSGLTPVTMSGEQFTALLAKFSAGKPEDEPANEPADKPADEPADKPAEPTAVTLSAEQFASMMGKAVPKPAVVIPPVKAVVKEALPYTFDRGGNFVPDNRHDFSTDLHAMAQAGDNFGTGTEFGKRVMGILKAEFATLTGDINELNPTIDRPDMYVDQRDYRVPLWESINKGAPPNGVQPFRFPKFNASSGLIGPHAEGVEPVAGAFTTTDQTVTPAALSGKATLTREVWDRGGNPAVSTLVYN